MSYYLIEVESFILVDCDGKPTELQAKDYVKEEIGQLVDHMHTKINRD